MRQGKEVGLFLTQDQTLFTDGHVPTEVTGNHFTAVGSREGPRADIKRGRDVQCLTVSPGWATILGAFRLVSSNGSVKTKTTN